MSRAARTRLAIAAVVIALGAWLYASSRARAGGELAALERLARAASQRSGESESARDERYRRELPGLLAADVRVTLPDGHALSGRDTVVAELIRLSRGRRPVASVKSPRLRSATANAADVELELVLSDSQAGDLHAAPRRARAELAKDGDTWQVRSLQLDAESWAEPEARP